MTDVPTDEQIETSARAFANGCTDEQLNDAKMGFEQGAIWMRDCYDRYGRTEQRTEAAQAVNEIERLRSGIQHIYNRLVLGDHHFIKSQPPLEEQLRGILDGTF